MEVLAFDEIFTKEELNTPKIAKVDFVKSVGELLRLAKPYLVNCAYEKTDKGRETVKVTCQNGHCYSVDVTGDSLCAIAEDVFNVMSGK